MSKPLDGLMMPEPEQSTRIENIVCGENLTDGRDTVSRTSSNVSLLPPSPRASLPVSQALPPPIRFQRNLNRRTQPRQQTTLEPSEQNIDLTTSEPIRSEVSPELELSQEQLERLEQEVFLLIMSELI